MEMKTPYTAHQKYTDEGIPIWRKGARFAEKVRDCGCEIDDLTFNVKPFDPHIIYIHTVDIYPAQSDTVLLYILVLFGTGNINSPHRIAKLYTLDRISEDLMLYPSKLAEKIYQIALDDYNKYILADIEKLGW